MSVGSGIAVAAFLLAFVWAVTVSENAAAGVFIAGILIGIITQLRKG